MLFLGHRLGLSRFHETLRHGVSDLILYEHRSGSVVWIEVRAAYSIYGAERLGEQLPGGGCCVTLTGDNIERIMPVVSTHHFLVPERSARLVSLLLRLARLGRHQHIAHFTALFT